jgi:hypothetical protein
VHGIRVRLISRRRDRQFRAGSEEEIDDASRSKAMKAHPDKGGSAAPMAKTNEARRRLKKQYAA